MTTLEALTGFPGYSDAEPLTVPDAANVFGRWLAHGTLDALGDAMGSVGFCAHPVRLTGTSTTIDAASGEVLHHFDTSSTQLGVLHRPCGNRRESVCPACSRVYARDTFEMIRAGVLGGKTIPTTVAANPLLFVTLTAPSFGLVHRVRRTKTGPGPCRPRRRDHRTRCQHGRPTWCDRTHTDTHDAVGQPLCSDCYDYTSHVVWQWHAPELWRRTTIALKRHLAKTLHVPVSRPKKGGLCLDDVARLEYAKVAEYQARGVVHFHALIRLDGPHGPGTPAPLTGEALADVIHAAATGATVTAPPTGQDDPGRVLRWGTQLDIRIVQSGEGAGSSDRSGPVTPEQVAAYLAKYATKDATSTGTRHTPHAVRLRTLCDDLAQAAKDRDRARNRGEDVTTPVDPKTGLDPHRLLGKWAHMLGFRGHFSTKSRAYSVTLTRLRRARYRWQRLTAEAARNGTVLDTADLEARLLADDADDETTLVINNLAYAGSGWNDDTETALALAAAGRAREYAQWKATQNRT